MNYSLKIYVASSWRNKRQPQVVEQLGKEGYEVYDFRHPAPGNDGFHWDQIDREWKQWSPLELIRGLTHPLAEEGYGVRCNGQKSESWSCRAGEALILRLGILWERVSHC